MPLLRGIFYFGLVVMVVMVILVVLVNASISF